MYFVVLGTVYTIRICRAEKSGTRNKILAVPKMLEWKRGLMFSVNTTSRLVSTQDKFPQDGNGQESFLCLVF